MKKFLHLYSENCISWIFSAIFWKCTQMKTEFCRSQGPGVYIFWTKLIKIGHSGLERKLVQTQECWKVLSIQLHWGLSWDNFCPCRIENWIIVKLLASLKFCNFFQRQFSKFPFLEASYHMKNKGCTRKKTNILPSQNIF